MADEPTESETRWLVLEMQLWITCLAGGLIAFTVGGSSLFLTWGLMALGGAAKLDAFGVSRTGVAVALGVVLTTIIAGRLRGYVVSMAVGTGSVMGNVVSLGDLDHDEAVTFCREMRPTMALGAAFFTLIGIGAFRAMRWSCVTARSTGGPTHAVCLWFEEGPFQELLLLVTRLTIAGFGVGGVLFLGVLLLELRFGWRQSALQRRYRESSLYWWLHPTSDLRQAVRRESEENDDDPE